MEVGGNIHDVMLHRLPMESLLGDPKASGNRHKLSMSNVALER
jgi:hypothetical protein